MIARLAAIFFIFICTALAWLILGGTLQQRSDSADSQLRGRVASTWGTAHEQRPPTASWQRDSVHTVTTMENGKSVEKTEKIRVTEFLPLESTAASAAFDLDHRQKGLRWYSTYKVAF